MKNKLSVLLSVVLLFTYSSLSAQVDQLLFSPNGVAEVHITLLDGKQIGDIKNEKNDGDYAGPLKAKMEIKNSKTSTYAEDQLFSGTVEIDGRGNTTWGVPKRPYNIDLIDDAGEELKVPLLDMPAHDEWCLLAFWHDRSLMRIPMAMFLGRHMDGFFWAPRLQYVEVFINGDYRGLYNLCEKIGRGDDRLNIKKLTTDESDQVEPRVSGGYILEGSSLGKLKPIEQQRAITTSEDNIIFSFKYPKSKNVTDEQRAWIKSYLDEFERVLRSEQYKDPTNGYRKYINVESFIDWTILHEQSRGCDNLFHASTFIHKDRNDRINMSAPWDFDLSYGNSGVWEPEGTWVRTHRWFNRLFRDDAYADLYRARLDELMPLFNQIPEMLAANYEQLEASGCIAREEAKWPQILWEYSSQDALETPLFHKAHVQYLSDWVATRNAWCYLDIAKNDNDRANRLNNTKPVIRVMDVEAMESGGRFTVKIMKSSKDENTYTYLWNDTPGNGVAANQRIIKDKGKYWVKIRDANGNISLASDTLYFGVEPPVSIENMQPDMDISYSNPAREVLTLNYSCIADAATTVSLFDVRGVMVKQHQVATRQGYNQVVVPLTGLQPGLYVMRVQTGSQTTTKKLIVAR